jgi:ABC-type antimicrobial peptide transport system permease subunit
MNPFPKVVAIIMIVGGAVMIVAGATTYYLVHTQLADEKIVVSDDAERFAGEPVEGPFTAYSEAETIKKHAAEIADGQTYAQLDQDDPRRESVMTASFLRASLFTSVVAFGVAALVIGLGILFVLLGIAMLMMVKRIAAPVDDVVEADVLVVEGAPMPPPTTAPATG